MTRLSTSSVQTRTSCHPHNYAWPPSVTASPIARAAPRGALAARGAVLPAQPAASALAGLRVVASGDGLRDVAGLLGALLVGDSGWGRVLEEASLLYQGLH